MGSSHARPHQQDKSGQWLAGDQSLFLWSCVTTTPSVREYPFLRELPFQEDISLQENISFPKDIPTFRYSSLYSRGWGSLSKVRSTNPLQSFCRVRPPCNIIYSATKVVFLPERGISTGIGQTITGVRYPSQQNKKPLQKFSENFCGVVLVSKSLNLMTLVIIGGVFHAT